MSGAGTCSSATFRHARHCRTERRPHIRGPIGTPASCSSVAPISASESTSTLAAQSASMAGNAPTDSNSSRRAATSASMDRPRERKKEAKEDVSRKKLKTKIRVFFLRTRARSKTRRASLHVGSLSRGLVGGDSLSLRRSRAPCGHIQPPVRQGSCT